MRSALQGLGVLVQPAEVVRVWSTPCFGAPRETRMSTLPPLGLTDGERAELQRRVRAHTTHNATSVARG